MSNHRFVTSLGSPYFAFVAAGIGDLATLPSGGLAAISAEIRVDSLPVQSATADELHPFFAFNHDIATQPPIFEVGVTPSGRLKALAKSGGVYQSRAGIFSDATVWNTIQVTYGVQAPGQWDVTINGVNDLSQVDGAPQNLLPNAGYGTRILLYNGRDGLARTGISVRSLLATFVGLTGDSYLWSFGEKAGPTLAPSVLGDELPGSGIATARWYDPLTSHPWGSVPSGAPAGAYRWGLATDWTRLPKPATNYTRVPA